MKTISKKNIKKTKFSKKNKTIHKTINKIQIQHGGVFMKEHIGAIEQIMREIDIDYKQPFKTVYKQLVLILHPDKNFGKTDVEKATYERYFQIINDFNIWVKEYYNLNEIIWNQAIQSAKSRANNLNSRPSSSADFPPASNSSSYPPRAPPINRDIDILASLKTLEIYFYDNNCNYPYHMKGELNFEDVTLDNLDHNCIRFAPEKLILRDIIIKLQKQFGERIIYRSIKDLKSIIENNTPSPTPSSHSASASTSPKSESSQASPAQEIPSLTLEEKFHKLQEYYEINKCYEKEGHFQNRSFIDNTLNHLLQYMPFTTEKNPLDMNIFKLTLNIKGHLGNQFDELKDKTIKDIYLQFNIPIKESNRKSTSTNINNSKKKKQLEIERLERKSKLEKERDAIEKKIEKLIEEQIKLDTEITKLTSKFKILEENLKSEMENIETINNELSKL
jgi:hypothetical protein